MKGVIKKIGSDGLLRIGKDVKIAKPKLIRQNGHYKEEYHHVSLGEHEKLKKYYEDIIKTYEQMDTTKSDVNYDNLVELYEDRIREGNELREKMDSDMQDLICDNNELKKYVKVLEEAVDKSTNDKKELEKKLKKLEESIDNAEIKMRTNIKKQIHNEKKRKMKLLHEGKSTVEK